MNRRSGLLILALLLTGLGHAPAVLAVTCTSVVAGGNWNATTTWAGSCVGGNGTPANTPGNADAVFINTGGGTVTLTANAAAASITFNSGSGVRGINLAGFTLDVGGAVIMSAPSGSGSSTFTVGTGRLNAASIAINGGAASRISLVTVSTGRIDTTGSITFGGTAGNARFTSTDASTVNVGGNFGSGGTLTTSGTGTINFNGGAAQTIGLYTTYNNIQINNTAGGVQFSAGTTTIGGTLNVTTGTLDIRGVTLNVNGATTIDGTVSFTTSATGAKTFSGAVTVNGTWSNTINEDIILGAGLTNSGTFGAGNGAYTLTGSLVNTNTFNAGTGNFSLSGNFTNNGTFNSSTGTFTFNGGAAQSITGTASGTTTFANLTLSNANGLSLTGTHNVTVSTLLTLTTGAITTGANVLFISNGSNIASAGGTDFVIGNLQKAVATGAPTSVFEIGTGTSYTPVTLVFASVTTAGNLTATTTATDHPDVANSGLNSALSVNRYWTFTNSGVVFTTYNATFTFVAGDLDASADTTIFEVSSFSPPSPAAGTWSSSTVGTRTATTTQITGAAGFGDFAVGQPLASAGGIGRFNAYDTTTAAGAVTGKIMTKIAGAAFNVDVIAIVTNRKSINTNFTGTVRVELLDASDNSGTLDTATGCNTSWTVIQTITPDPVFVSGDNGRKTISVTENNSWRQARFRIQNFPAATLTGCSTDAFAIRPQSLTVTAHDGTWETAGITRPLANTSASGGEVHKASTSAATTPRPFTLRVTPVPASATNYDGSPTTTSGFPTCGTLCTTPGTLTFTGGSWTSAGGGVRENATANYSEAGTFNLQLEDTSFAVVDALDGTPDTCSNSSPIGRRACATATAEIGRFVPERFELASLVTPVFLTFGPPMCAFTRSFTYVGKSFWFGTTPSATLNAVNAAGAVTTNYPLATTSSMPAISETFADSTAPATAPLSTTLVGTPGPFTGAGTATYSPSASGLLFYTRSTAAPPPSPPAPFNAAISLTVSASDSTESAVSGNGTITTPTPLVYNGSGSGIAFDGADFNAGAGFTGGRTLVYGRLGIRNASGSQLVPLTMQMETQYWNGTSFITNTADSCTAIAASAAASNVAMSGFTNNLTESPCDTALSGGGTFSSGRKTFLLAAPGTGNNGSVNLTVNLGSGAALGTTCRTVGVAPVADSGANLLFLMGNWTGSTFDQNPSARATFGVYRGSEEIIDIRENF